MKLNLTIVKTEADFLKINISKKSNNDHYLLFYDEGNSEINYEDILIKDFESSSFVYGVNDEDKFLVISSKVLKASTNPTYTMKKAIELIPFISSFVFLLTSSSIREETYQFLNTISDFKKVLETQVYFIYSSDIEKRFYDYFDTENLFSTGAVVFANNLSNSLLNVQRLSDTLILQGRLKSILRSIMIVDYILLEPLPGKTFLNYFSFLPMFALSKNRILSHLNDGWKDSLPKIESLSFYKFTSHYDVLSKFKFENQTTTKFKDFYEYIEFYEKVLNSKRKIIDIKKLKELDSKYLIHYYGSHGIPLLYQKKLSNKVELEIDLGLSDLRLFAPLFGKKGYIF